MMLDQQRGSGDDALAKRSNRRETWCPGAKGGWAAPPGALSDSGAASGSGHTKSYKQKSDKNKNKTK